MHPKKKKICFFLLACNRLKNPGFFSFSSSIHSPHLTPKKPVSRPSIKIILLNISFNNFPHLRPSPPEETGDAGPYKSQPMAAASALCGCGQSLLMPCRLTSDVPT